MILLSMVIMNLSVAAVIEGLAEASKENTGIVSGDQIDILIEKWKDYDTNASGLISYKDLIFLLYEVPPPLGLGNFTSYYSTRSNYSNMPDYGANDENKDDIKNINNLGLQDRYMIQEEKQIYIKKSDAIKIFNDYSIPLIGEEEVHFKDVAKALIEKIFQKNKLSYTLTGPIDKRLNKQWEGKYTALRKFKDLDDKINTGVMEANATILKYYRRKKHNQRGKTYGRSAFKAINSDAMGKNNKVFTDAKLFTEARINNYLVNAQKEEAKNEEEFEVFRTLVNENVKMTHEDQNYIERSKYKNEQLKFSWFQQLGNFEIEGHSSEDEKQNSHHLK